MAAFIGKKEVPFEAAILRMRELLGSARMPVIAGLGADVAGMRAVLRVAAQLGCALDFCRTPGATNLLRPLMDKGFMFTTPREARSRADVLMLVGPSMGRAEAITDILEGQPELSAGESARRDVLWLCPNGATDTLSRFDMLVADADFSAIHGILATLNAAVRSRHIGEDGFGALSGGDYEEIAGRLLTARYGVIAFSPEDLDPLAIEALAAFAEKLGHATRVVLLPVITHGAGQTAALVSSWTTGFPPRLGFERGYPEFDLWRYDAERLCRTGEADALLWLSPFEARAPDWKADIPVIALTRPGAVFARAPEIIIETEISGVDGPAELFSARYQILQPLEARPGGMAAPTPAAILEQLLSHLEALAA
jgi:formylmethanofuran dehydrogenase subunit B